VGEKQFWWYCSGGGGHGGGSDIGKNCIYCNSQHTLSTVIQRIEGDVSTTLATIH